MQYIIFVLEGEEAAPILWSRSVAPGEETYLRESVFPALRLLSEEEYKSGPTRILNTAAHYSYVLDDDTVYWCVEWEPGLLVVRCTSDGALALAELHSPNPQFGGREATPEELANYDEDNEEEGHQYNLIFDAWDAQFDEDEREDWEIVDEETRRYVDAALETIRKTI